MRLHYQMFNRNEVLKMYSEDLYYPIIDSISELLKVMIKILTDAVKSVRDSDKCKIQTNKTLPLTVWFKTKPVVQIKTIIYSKSGPPISQIFGN